MPIGEGLMTNTNSLCNQAISNIYRQPNLSPAQRIHAVGTAQYNAQQIAKIDNTASKIYATNNYKQSNGQKL